MRMSARAYLDGLLAAGRHTFTRSEALLALKSSPIAVYHALRRLRLHGGLAMPRRGFYLIVDPAHRHLGALPPSAWIDDLMRFHGAHYYVGLLSAAAFYGAGSQPVQEFQVVADRVLRPVLVGRVRIKFFYRKRFDPVVTAPHRTSGAAIPVSTAEMTAFDLVRYRKGAGSLDHVANVLAEMAEHLEARRLLAVADPGEELPVIQRLGWLLDRVGHPGPGIELARLVARRNPDVVLLEPRSREAVVDRDLKWRVLVNTTIEVEA